MTERGPVYFHIYYRSKVSHIRKEKVTRNSHLRQTLVAYCGVEGDSMWDIEGFDLTEQWRECAKCRAAYDKEQRG